MSGPRALGLKAPAREGLDRQLGDDIGLTAVLHTHARNLAPHPHVHVVVPGGGRP